MPKLEPGTVLEGTQAAYEIEREIGSGGFGVTYLARRQADGQPVALKRLHIGRVEEWKNIELFNREVAVLRRLSHPNIPDYIDNFTAGGPVLVQEFVEGHNLQQAVRGEVTMDERQFVNVLAQILGVLDYLHHLTPSVLHRDVTPKNIIVRPDGKAFLVDFGAVRTGLASTLASTTAGTFGYAPMEQFVSQAFPASDIYGLGMSFVALASGREPADMSFSGMRVDVQRITSLDARLSLLLTRMTEPDPARRLGDARIALEQLRPLLARYGHEHVAAQDMQLVAERQPQPEGRAARAADALLPSERMREAAARLELLGKGGFSPPRYKGVVIRDCRTSAYDTTGSLLAIDGQLIDIEQMRVIDLVQGCIRAVSPSGELLVTSEDEDSRTLEVIHRREGKLHKQAELVLEERVEFMELSPDGRSLLVKCKWRDKTAFLYDLASGSLTQRFAGDWNGARFSPDGSSLALYGTSPDSVIIHNRAGDETRLAGMSGIAYAPDGRTAALFSEHEFRLHRADELERSPLQKRGFAEWRRWEHPRFSPDGRWLAVFDDRTYKVLVFDGASGRLVLELAHPGGLEQEIRTCENLAFSVDGSRIFVSCRIYCNRYSDDHDDMIAIWELPSGRYLGAVTLDDRRRHATAVTVSGFYGRLQRGDEPLATRADVWCRPEVSRRALRAQPIDELLDEKDRARLADLEARWTFFEDQRIQGAIEKDAPGLRMLEAAQGLTHVLDLIIERARQAQQEVSSFGQAASTKLTADQVVAAARRLADRPAAELDLLHSELLARAVAAEEVRAKQLAEERAAEEARDLPRARAEAADAQRVVERAEQERRRAEQAAAGLAPRECAEPAPRSWLLPVVVGAAGIGLLLLVVLVVLFVG